MKTTFQLNYVNISKLSPRHIRLFRKLFIYFLSIFFFTFSLFFLNQYFIVFIIFSICVASMLPLRYANWSGCFDMNTILTCFTTINYGLSAGLFVGNASLVGIILAGDVDNSILFDWILSMTIAILAFISPFNFIITTTTIAIFYFIGYILFHIYCDTLEFTNISWATTNILWIIFVLWQILPKLSHIWL